MGMKSTGGEIVQVQGGHIVRSTGRKDRHSKVYTAKGPRDRRVRLSAHTAIQFYDVQDRLGYDRPSKAVDWLIKKAKSAIDKLAELPPWHPTTVNNNNTVVTAATAATAEEEEEEEEAPEIGIPEETESSGYNFQFGHNNNNNFQIDSDAIAFFPTTSAAAASINFQNYPSAIISRTANPSEDLGLSLHSFQDSGLIHGGQSSQADVNPVGFVSWNNSDAAAAATMLVGQQGSTFPHRGTLQSSFLGWNDIAMNNNNNNNNNKSQAASSIFGSRFVSAADGMGIHGFCIPARIQGEEEDDHGGIASSDHNRPSSSASNSHH